MKSSTECIHLPKWLEELVGGVLLKGPQGIWTFVKRLKDPKLFVEILDKDAVEGRVLPMYTHVCIKCWQLLHSKKSSWKTNNGVAHAAAKKVLIQTVLSG